MVTNLTTAFINHLYHFAGTFANKHARYFYWRDFNVSHWLDTSKLYFVCICHRRNNILNIDIRSKDFPSEQANQKAWDQSKWGPDVILWRQYPPDVFELQNANRYGNSGFSTIIYWRKVIVTNAIQILGPKSVTASLHHQRYQIDVMIKSITNQSEQHSWVQKYNINDN